MRYEETKAQKRKDGLKDGRGPEEERGGKARGCRNARIEGVRPNLKGRRGDQHENCREEGCGSHEIVRSGRRRVETVVKSLGRLDRVRLVVADLRCCASRRTEPCDFGFHGKQRRQDTEQNAQRRQSRMPDQEASLHIQQFTIKAFRHRPSAGTFRTLVCILYEMEGGS